MVQDAAQNQSIHRRRFRPWLVLSIAVAMGILLSLGTWQVQRLAWKEELLATIDSRIASEPKPLLEVEALYASEEDVEYVPVSLSGTFEHDAEQFFLATHQGQSGWYVYTPLRLSDGRALIVNRGFIPYDRRDPESREWEEVEGQVSFTALARNPLFEKPGFVVPDNRPDDNTWYWKDFPSMRDQMGLSDDETLPFFADARENPAGERTYPVAGVTIIALPNNHLQYAVTWYGLAAALAAVAGFMFFRKPDEHDLRT